MLFHCGSFQFDLSRPLVMGVINVTPDSFSDGGLHAARDDALVHAQKLIADGADILDIGGESTRPGAMSVGVQQELDRVMPVLDSLRGAPVPVSIDTSKPEVMRAAIAAGAQMINDINALQEPAAMDAVSSSDVAICLMHKQGNPQTMQAQPCYDNVVSDVTAFLRGRVAAAVSAGISPGRIAIDPGFGFGKTLAHNLELLNGLRSIVNLNFPVLAGLSRKSMLGAITGREVGDRVAASVAAAMLAVQKGAGIVRVHDVRETVDALRILQASNGGRW